ncbi:hypothetical protein TNCV_3424511 [Trichonephila clavipes]|nr:hypothetical protein TNCV_3424511 [Trichonephila clavipes]
MSKLFNATHVPPSRCCTVPWGTRVTELLHIMEFKSNDASTWSLDSGGQVMVMQFISLQPVHQIYLSWTSSRSDIHQVQCIGAGGRDPFWHGRKEGKPCQQPGQAGGRILPKSHVRWIGESGQQPRLSPGGCLGIRPTVAGVSHGFQKILFS